MHNSSNDKIICGKDFKKKNLEKYYVQGLFHVLSVSYQMHHWKENHYTNAIFIYFEKEKIFECNKNNIYTTVNTVFSKQGIFKMNL